MRKNHAIADAATSGDDELRAVTEALNRLDDFTAVGRGGLAAQAFVNAALRSRRAPDTAFQRGRVLTQLIRDEVERNFAQRRADSAASDLAEWSILYLRVHEGRTLQEIAEALGMPRRSVDRYYQRAKALLLDRLHGLAEPVREARLHCPLCGQELRELVALPPSLRCPRCRASIEITPAEQGQLDLRVRAWNSD